MLAWLWINLLQFCVSNQVFSPDEDAINKSWRPIPSGLISLEAAVWLRWTLLPFCILTSYWLGVAVPGALLSFVVILHNECGLARHWLTKNGCCAVGYALFEWGATCLASGQHLTMYQAYTVYASTLVIGTTIHAQDFRDIDGDLHLKRSTLPLAFPRCSRHSMFPILIAWSILASRFCQHSVVTLVVIVLGSSVGIRFSFLRNMGADETTYRMYNIWLATIHLIIGSFASLRAQTT